MLATVIVLCEKEFQRTVHGIAIFHFILQVIWLSDIGNIKFTSFIQQHLMKITCILLYPQKAKANLGGKQNYYHYKVTIIL